MIKWFEKYNKLSWAITILIALIIFYVSSLTVKQTSGLGNGPNSVFYHITIFFLFSFFLLISLVRGKNRDLILIVIAVSIIYAVLDEMHQFFVPGRASSFRDIILDSIGILSALIVYLFSIKYRRIKNRI